MARDVEVRQQQRAALLNYVYDATDGRQNTFVDCRVAAQDLGMDLEDVFDAMGFLIDEWKLRAAGGGHVMLTSSGISSVEALRTQANGPADAPNQTTVLIAGNVTGSNLQVGTHGSSQTLNFDARSAPELEAILDELARALPDLPLTDEDKAEIAAQADTVRAQLRSTRSERASLITGALRIMGDILKQATSSVVSMELARQIMTLLQHH